MLKSSINEIEVYIVFEKYNDLTNLNIDLHIHSTFTDGKDSITDIVKQAEAINLETIAITDHIRENSTYFDEYIQEIIRIRKNTNIKILIGFEARIKNFQGEVDVANEIYAKSDIKIASVHRFTIGKKVYNPDFFPKEIAQGIEFDLSLAALKNINKEFNVLGHPGGMSLRYFNDFPLEYYEEIIIACKENNIAFDLNSHYHRSVYPELIKLLKEHNPLISLGSDAHNKLNIGKWTTLLKGEI